MSKQMEAQLRQAKQACAALQDEVVLLKRELKQAQVSGVPEGWKLVPMEMTAVMLIEFMGVGLRHAEYKKGCSPTSDEIRQGYRHMLAAAPEPPCAAPVSDNAGCESETEENDQQDQMDGIEKACQRYTEMILDRSPDLTASRDDTSRPRRPSGSHVLWMLEQIPTLSPTKAHRWLGFIQCALVSHGLTTIDAERKATRGMFDEGAAKQEETCDSPDSSLFDRVQEVITAVYDRDMQIEDAAREVIDLCDGTASAKQEASHEQ